MLTLVLRSNSWDDLIAKKQTRAVQKLALFFNIPPVRLIMITYTNPNYVYTYVLLNSLFLILLLT